jgi:hypothetical protein
MVIQPQPYSLKTKLFLLGVSIPLGVILFLVALSIGIAAEIRSLWPWKGSK